MRKGRFKPSAQVHLACYNNNKFLVNGQHTLHAIKSYGSEVAVTYMETQCESMFTMNNVTAQNRLMWHYV